MKFLSRLTSLSLYLATTVSCREVVRTYNALTPASVLVQYRDANDAGRLLLVSLNSANKFAKLQGFTESDLQAYIEEQEAQAAGETVQFEGSSQGVGAEGQQDRRVSTSRSEPQAANELLRHGKEFIHFIKLYEATILHGPEDVACHFFSISLDERVMPEQSLIKNTKELRPFRRFSFGGEPLKNVCAIECEGSVDWEQDEA